MHKEPGAAHLGRNAVGGRGRGRGRGFCAGVVARWRVRTGGGFCGAIVARWRVRREVIVVYRFPQDLGGEGRGRETVSQSTRILAKSEWPHGYCSQWARKGIRHAVQWMWDRGCRQSGRRP